MACLWLKKMYTPRFVQNIIHEVMRQDQYVRFYWNLSFYNTNILIIMRKCGDFVLIQYVDRKTFIGVVLFQISWCIAAKKGVHTHQWGWWHTDQVPAMVTKIPLSSVVPSFNSTICLLCIFFFPSATEILFK